MYESFSLSDQGSYREKNEDTVFACPDLKLWLLADGVGGHGNGNVASQLAVQTIERSVRSGASLQQAVREADQAILSAVDQNPEMQGMATTIVACRIEETEFELTWVGDSRAYLFDGHQLQQLTVDHSLSEEGNELTQALGCLSLDELPVCKGFLKTGDTLLLCSDGLSSVLSTEALQSLLSSDQDIASLGHALIDTALANDTKDNVSVVLLRKEQSEEYESNEVVYRSPFDRSRYDTNIQSRPLFLLLLLISILFVLLVL